MTWLYALASVTGISLLSLIGVFTLSFNTERLRRLLFVLVSLAAGAMFGDAFIHILPEAFRNGQMSTSLLVLLGIFLFFTLEKFLRWQHAHNVDDIHVPHPVGLLNLVSDGLHNLIDGVLIGASYLVSVQVGLATTLAVALHELPQEIGDFGVLLHAGYSTRKALCLNFLSASVAILGTLIALALGARSAAFSQAMLPITAGSFIYIAGSDLVPEMVKEQDTKRSLIQLLGMAAGMGMMLLLALAE